MKYGVLILVCALTASAGAQPPREGGPVRPHAGDPPRMRQGEQPRPPQNHQVDPERDRAMLKARLESRLAEARQMQERLESAVQRLDEGASAAAIRADLEVPGEREWRRPMSRPQVGPGSGGPPPAGHGEGRGRRERLTDEERQAFVQYVQEHAPELAQRVQHLRDEHPMLADRMLSRMEPRLRLMMAEEDLEMRELRREELRAGWDVVSSTRQLADAIRGSADEMVVGNLAQSLRTALGEHFDLRQAMQEREIAMLESRLAQLRTEMDAHLVSRDEHVEQRVDAIIRAVRQRSESEDQK